MSKSDCLTRSVIGRVASLVGRKELAAAEFAGDDAHGGDAVELGD